MRARIGRRPEAWIDDALDDWKRRDLSRNIVASMGMIGTEITIDGCQYISLASNNYLGLAGDPRLAKGAVDALQRYGSGAGASPLVSGYSTIHRELEEKIAEMKRAEDCLLFPSGYQTNLGTISALVGRGDVVFSDELNHASIIDGCRLSQARISVYKHRDVDHLRTLIQHASIDGGRRLIVTDGVFSMDGDVAPLHELVDVAESHDCLLMVDEAHATGVLGRSGAGAIEQYGLEDRIQIVVGTLSKALGAAGGFVVGSRNLIGYLRERSRPYIYSTALPSSAVGAALVAIDIVASEPERRRRVMDLSRSLADGLMGIGYAVLPPSSAIVPILVGSALDAVALSSTLRRFGVFCPAIRPPTVPEGQSRLRVTPIATHSDKQMEKSLAAFEAARGEIVEQRT